MRTLRQPVDDHPDGIVTLGTSGQGSQKVHRNILPFSLRNGQWLQQAGGPLMLHLDLLANQALRHESGHLTLHTIPPIMLAKIPVHLGTPGMNRVW